MARIRKGPKYLPSKLNTPMLNYREYYLSFSEKLGNILLLFVGGGIVGLVFYGGQFRDIDGLRTNATYVFDIVIFVVLGILANVLLLPIRKKQLKEKRKKVIIHQFRALLAALSSSLSSGMNVQDSLESAYKDLVTEFSENGYVTREVREILNGIRNNIALEEMMKDFGERSEVEDIENFGIVFAMSIKTGANLKDVVRRTDNIMGEKIEILEQIETAITSNKMQFNVMMIVPVAMVMLLRVMSSSFAVSFSTVPGVIAMTIAIGLFIAAYFMGQNIMDIK